MKAKLEVSARGIAREIIKGARAEVVDHKYLSGFALQYMEVDGVLAQLPPQEMKEAPAVRVTKPDGFVALWVAASPEQADALLARAYAIAEAYVPSGGAE